MLLPLISVVQIVEGLLANYPDQLPVHLLLELKTEIFPVTLIVSIFSLFGTFLLLAIIIAPLREIIKKIKGISRGNFKEHIEVNSGDELQTLTDNLNKMSERFSRIVEREKTISQMKSDFVSLTAHQLRTPISGIKWAINTILAGKNENLTTEQNQLLRKINEKNESVILTIKDLMDVMRIEEGKFLYDLKEEFLEPIIQELFQEKLPNAHAKNIALGFVKSRDPVPPLLIDSQNIRLALENLIDNAIEYTPQNGKVTISFARQEKNAIINISDSGVGIPEDELGRIFDKFFRGIRAIRMQTEGNGLGLYISKNIIKHHGGKIRVVSKEGQGSTFSVTLPIPEKFLGKEKYKEFIAEF